MLPLLMIIQYKETTILNIRIILVVNGYTRIFIIIYT